MKRFVKREQGAVVAVRKASKGQRPPEGFQPINEQAYQQARTELRESVDTPTFEEAVKDILREEGLIS